MIKQPNPTMKHNQDWIEIDLEALSPNFIPATAYQPNRDMPYNEEYAKWESDGAVSSARHGYRIAWRQMAASTGFRTLYPAVLPPGTAHVNGVISGGFTPGQRAIPIGLIGGYLSSILVDFVVRSAGTHLWPSLIERMPIKTGSPFSARVESVYLRLNCLTVAYAQLWEENDEDAWSPEVPLRNAKERSQAQNEIDAIVALSLGITADELCMIYRTQFPVMRRYDQEDLFDRNGRRVAKEVVKLENKLEGDEQLSEVDRTWVHPQSEVTYVFEYPFAPLDREADLRAAYALHASEITE